MPLYRLSDREKAMLVQLVQDLVRIPSVSADDVTGCPEAGVADYLETYFRRLDMDVQRIVMPPNRPNLLASWPQDHADDRKRLVLTVHMDTVEPDGMTIDPFAADVRDGRIWGRGTCDTKGALAAYLWVLSKVRELKLELPWKLEFLAVCDEETGCTGSRWLVDQGVSADYMIVGEPTGCRIATCHRGRVMFKIITEGIAAHASVPDRGVNAVYRMNDAINVLRQKWLPTLGRPRHEQLGSTTSSLTLVRGGRRDNIVPDRCQAVFDTRTIPGHDQRQFLETIRSLISTVDGASVDVIKSRSPLDTDSASPLVQGLLQTCRTLREDDAPAALPYLTDASNFAETGAHCVVFGPGGIDKAHSADEYLEIDQLHRSAEILLAFLLDLADGRHR